MIFSEGDYFVDFLAMTARDSRVSDLLDDNDVVALHALKQLRHEYKMLREHDEISNHQERS
jgi:hypothetical protein